MKKILLVEDNEFLRELYADILQDEGYDLNIAKEGNEAYRLLEKGGYDLVLLDLLLPNKNGIDILKDLKKSPPKKENKKIILLSNVEDENIIKEAEKMVQGTIMKSQITPDVLVEKIKGYLAT